MSNKNLLEIDSVRIDVRVTRRKRLRIVDTASFNLQPGQLLGLIGESGSGKTMLCRSLVGTLQRRGAYVHSGSIRFDGVEIAQASKRQWQQIRGRQIGYIPQSALAGPNPVIKIGAQLAEAINQGEKKSAAEVKRRAIELLELVQIRRPEVVLKQYAYELSGGMKQRVMIACAIAQNPKLVVADEPTTGLDVTVQAEILDLLKRIRQEFKTSIILVSHDLQMINSVCDDIVVMHAGVTVEQISAGQIDKSRHPYTGALYDSRIDLVEPRGKLATIKGQPPTVGAWPNGCRFADRCDHVKEICRSTDAMPFLQISDSHMTACIRHEEVYGGKK